MLVSLKDGIDRNVEKGNGKNKKKKVKRQGWIICIKSKVKGIKKQLKKLSKSDIRTK